MTAAVSKYRIRAIADTEKHRREILEMRKECLPGNNFDLEDGQWFLAMFHAHCASPVPVAFAKVRQSRNYESCGYLECAGVMPGHRGHGLQRRLLAARERFARKAEWQWLVTNSCENPHSSNNLISFGFETFEPRKRWARRGSIYWRKFIGPTDGSRDKGPA